MAHTNEVQTVKRYLFVVQDANAGRPDGVEVLRVAREFFVISRDEKRAQRWR